MNEIFTAAFLLLCNDTGQCRRIPTPTTPYQVKASECNKQHLEKFVDGIKREVFTICEGVAP